MKKRLVCCLLLLTMILASCSSNTGTSSPTAQPASPVATHVATPVPIEFKWDQSILIDPATNYLISNATSDMTWDNIIGSAVTANRDTRWNLDLKIDKLTANMGDASTGIYLGASTSEADYCHLFFGYQSGVWHFGYAPSTAEGLTLWEDISSPTEMAGQFHIAISSDGKLLEIKNGNNLIYSHLFADRIFASDAEVGVSTQIGPQTALTISSLTIEQAPQTVTAITQLPVASSTTAGEIAYTIHVSPDGSDTNSGSQDAPVATITQAQQIVRQLSPTMTGPINVILHTGTYLLTTPLIFIENDSGQNGYPITYLAAEGENPILSGGVSVTGWQQMPDSKLWVATLPEDTKIFRQLYVNGVHAPRAAMLEAIKGQRYAKGEFSDRDGIIVSAGSIPNLTNPADVELHWIYDWKDMRLKVSNITDNNNGTKTIWMLQPYYSVAMGMEREGYPWFPSYDAKFYVENAPELVTQPGQWYYDQSKYQLYYYPLETETIDSAQVIIPQYQSLMFIKGNGLGHEVHDLSFKGLTFAYSNWTRASEVGTFGYQAQSILNATGQVMTPAHINLSSAKNVTMEGNQFLHMGAAAIHLGNNSTKLTIKGNLFYDIADTAMIVGSWDDDYLKSPTQVQPQDITISNNVIDSAGSEYRGAAGINAYYVANVKISHNELSNLPYSGISLGWGWSEKQDSTTCNTNSIANNLITDYAQIARDAGGIYTLGQQPGTVVNGNVFRRMLGDYACIYPDEGSAFITFSDNVCDTAPSWLNIWIPTIHDLSITNSYTNVSTKINYGTSITLDPPVIVNGQDWPAEAQTIMQQAGLEASFSYLRDWLTFVKK